MGDGLDGLAVALVAVDDAAGLLAGQAHLPGEPEVVVEAVGPQDAFAGRCEDGVEHLVLGLEDLHPVLCAAAGDVALEACIGVGLGGPDVASLGVAEGVAASFEVGLGLGLGLRDDLAGLPLGGGHHLLLDVFEGQGEGSYEAATTFMPLIQRMKRMAASRATTA